MVIAACAASLLLVVLRFRNLLGTIFHDRQFHSCMWLWIPVHLIAFVALAGVTAQTLGMPARASLAEVLGLLLAIGVSGMTWLAAAIAPSSWPVLFRRGRGVILSGAVIGAGTWAMSRFAQAAWLSSAAPTFWLAKEMLRAVFPEVVADPSRHVLGTPAFQVRIAPACSGYEGVGLVSLYLGLYVLLFRNSLRFPIALALIPAGAALAWIVNVLRIVTLISIGDSGSQELALGGFHSQAGWIAFNMIGLGLVAVAHRIRLFPPHITRNATAQNAAAPYLLPLLVLVATQMLAETIVNETASLYPWRIVVTAAVLIYFHRSVRTACIEITANTGRFINLFAILVGVTVFLLWIPLTCGVGEMNVPDPRSTMTNAGFAVWLGFRVLGSVLIVPLAEELAFRGYLVRRLISADFAAVPPRRFTWASFAISSVFFGLLHGHWIAGTLSGMAYAIVLYRRGRLSDCIVAHSTTNGLLAITALATNDWSIWS
jgi:exosortase E/protease (VPEID-CTERM system)